MERDEHEISLTISGPNGISISVSFPPGLGAAVNGNTWQWTTSYGNTWQIAHSYSNVGFSSPVDIGVPGRADTGEADFTWQAFEVTVHS